mmetsp:Transcript_5036/g.15329  ORF Transcript_5036/g.15329 Transcript_5036/m.15329 type:complete len:443 (+) Transcript_5036:20-1348(+)
MVLRVPGVSHPSSRHALAAAIAVLVLPCAVQALPPHGWDCISCGSNSMLAGNWAINNPNFNNSDLWWARTITSSYASIALNMNAGDPSLTVAQARILKKMNPKFKFLVYQNSELGPLTQAATRTINEHPEWWCRDDSGVPIGTKQGYFLNHTLADVREWYNNYPLQVFGDEAKDLLDGIFNDGMGYSPNSLHNTNLARHDAWFAGKMKLGDEARALYGGLNGGEVWGNGGIGDTAVYHNFTYDGQPVNWRTTMEHLDTGFLEGGGSFWYENTTTGEWIPEQFELFLESVINVSTAGKSAVLHFSPGTSFPPFVNLPQNATPSYNKFIACSWEGPVKLPTTADGVRQAAADVLVQALAPFLIVVNENVFLQYSWFYEMQDGNIPCPRGIECGMPSVWYPEFSKPLGPPKGPAVKNGYIWTREFAHASVYVDVRSRSASRVTWH